MTPLWMVCRIMMLPLLLTVAGCSAIVDSTELGFEKADTYIRSKTGAYKVKPVQPVRQQSYCYRTLGQIDCFDSPLAEGDERATGIGQTVKHPAQTTAYPAAPYMEPRAEAAPVLTRPLLPPPAPAPVVKNEPQELLKFKIGDKEFDESTHPTEADTAY